MNRLRLRPSRVALIAWLGLAVSPLAAQDRPLSVIEWLDDGLLAATPAPPLPAAPGNLATEPPVADSATVPEVEVRPLGAPSLAATGLLPPQKTGLPTGLWRASDAGTLRSLIERLDTSGDPAMTALLFTLLVAEADPPALSGDGAEHLAVRARKLLDMGAVDAAEALVKLAGAETPALFPVWLDAALLTGSENDACGALKRTPSLSSDLTARIFCAVRNKDWQTAATVFDSAVALGTIGDRRAELLSVFLNPELTETDTDLRPPVRPSPLEYRLFEAIGERPLTRTLPLPFAVIDLGGDAGWRAQIEAAERLAQAGAISENRLLGIYTERQPAASGGLWDRTEALQRFDQAMRTGDPGAIGSSLQRVWPMMRNARLAEPFAQLYGGRLLDFPVRGPAEELALQVALLSRDYELASARAAEVPALEAAAAIARGEAPATLPQGTAARAVAAAFSIPPEVPAPLQALLDENRLGEVILRAIELVGQGGEGNPQALTDGLLVLRAVGLEDAARRAALHRLLLDGERS